MPPPVIIDTNVFVAAGFNPRSASARLLEQVSSGQLRMVWTEETRCETRHILERIPRLSWNSFAALFRDADRYDGAMDPREFMCVPDPDDRKFAALAKATGVVLITSDSDLLDQRDRAQLEILSPGEFWRRQQP